MYSNRPVLFVYIVHSPYRLHLSYNSLRGKLGGYAHSQQFFLTSRTCHAPRVMLDSTISLPHLTPATKNTLFISIFTFSNGSISLSGALHVPTDFCFLLSTISAKLTEVIETDPGRIHRDNKTGEKLLEDRIKPDERSTYLWMFSGSSSSFYKKANKSKDKTENAKRNELNEENCPRPDHQNPIWHKHTSLARFSHLDLASTLDSRLTRLSPGVTCYVTDFISAHTFSYLGGGGGVGLSASLLLY